jgi:hypothetical protein
VFFCKIYVFAALATFNEWQKMGVRNKDPAFVSEFLNKAMTILTRVAQEEQSLNQNRAAFSLHPKKVNNVSFYLFFLLFM